MRLIDTSSDGIVFARPRNGTVNFSLRAVRFNFVILRAGGGERTSFIHKKQHPRGGSLARSLDNDKRAHAGCRIEIHFGLIYSRDIYVLYIDRPGAYIYTIYILLPLLLTASNLSTDANDLLMRYSHHTLAHHHDSSAQTHLSRLLSIYLFLAPSQLEFIDPYRKCIGKNPFINVLLLTKLSSVL